MAVSSAALKIIVKECCRSLSYNDEERQFSFPLRPSLQGIWKSKKNVIKSIQPDFTLSDFNAVLSDLEFPSDTHDKISIKSIKDEDLVNGEVLSVGISVGNVTLKLIKMKRGQYLDVLTGVGLSFGDKFEFCIGKSIVTSEGYDCGVCKSISILLPTANNVVLGRVFLGKYYLNDIGNSLWPIFDEAKEYLDSRDCERLDNILRISATLGVGSFAMLNILRGVCVGTT